MASIKFEAAAIATVATTALNSLANNAGALSDEIDNTSGLYMFAMCELNVTFGSNPTAGSTWDLYVIPAMDGTNYSDVTTGASGAAPASCYAGGFPLRAVTTAQRIPLGVGMSGPIPIPPGKFKFFVLNKGGQSAAASNNTLKAVLYRYQSA